MCAKMLFVMKKIPPSLSTSRPPFTPHIVEPNHYRVLKVEEETYDGEEEEKEAQVGTITNFLNTRTIISRKVIGSGGRG